jgi:chromosome segregation ATPase
MVNNINEAKKTRKKHTAKKKPSSGHFSMRGKGDSANTYLMQIKAELDQKYFILNDVETKIEYYAEQVARITEQVYLGKLQIYSIQKLAFHLGISREYLYDLMEDRFENAKLLKKALQGFKLALSDQLIAGGIEKRYSESLTKHYLPMYDSSLMEHEKAMALLKQMETPSTPISVILNKPSVTGKHQSNCGDTEPDGGF